MNLASIVERADEGILPAVSGGRFLTPTREERNCRRGAEGDAAVLTSAVQLFKGTLLPFSPPPGVPLHRQVAQRQPVAAGGADAGARAGAGALAPGEVLPGACTRFGREFPGVVRLAPPAGLKGSAGRAERGLGLHRPPPLPCCAAMAGPLLPPERRAGRPVRPRPHRGRWLPAVGRHDRRHRAEPLPGPGHGVMRRWGMGSAAAPLLP